MTPTVIAPRLHATGYTVIFVFLRDEYLMLVLVTSTPFHYLLLSLIVYPTVYTSTCVIPVLLLIIKSKKYVFHKVSSPNLTFHNVIPLRGEWRGERGNFSRIKRGIDSLRKGFVADSLCKISWKLNKYDHKISSFIVSKEKVI